MAFRIALPILPYRDPKIIYNIADIHEILNKEDLKNPIIITDRTIKSLGLTGELEDSLKENKLNYTLFSDTVPNPTTEVVEKAVKMYIENVL